MSVLDLKAEIARMTDERKGVSDNIALYNDYKDLQTLKQNLQEMLDVRNGIMARTRRTCSNHVGTVCSENLYSNVNDTDLGIDKKLSLKDIDDAISKIAYCTCDSRQGAEGCICKANYEKNYCECNGRSIVTCECRSRNGGKYADEWAHCSCRERQATLCSCESRTAIINCNCDSRCSCDVQKEFSYVPPDNNCLCNTKWVPDCDCNTKQVTTCTYNYCSCVSRENIFYQTSIRGGCPCNAQWIGYATYAYTVSGGCEGDSSSWTEYKTLSTGLSAGSKGAWKNSEDTIPTTWKVGDMHDFSMKGLFGGTYTVSLRLESISLCGVHGANNTQYWYSKCQNNINTKTATINACMCQSRCGNNMQKIMK